MAREIRNSMKKRRKRSGRSSSQPQCQPTLPTRFGVRIGVQKMVESEVSGVIFTLDPVNGDPSKIIIESSWGLGEALVAGVVRPDRFIIDKGTLQIVHKEIVPKMVEHVPNHQTGLTMEREVPAERR